VPTWQGRGLTVSELRTFAALCAEHGPLATTALYLDDNGFGDEGLGVLTPLLCDSFPSLARLHLPSNNLSEAGIRALCAAPLAQPLVELELSGNRIGSAGLAALGDAIKAGRLLLGSGTLGVQNIGATAEAEERFWSAAPKLAGRVVETRFGGDASAFGEVFVG